MAGRVRKALLSAALAAMEEPPPVPLRGPRLTAGRAILLGAGLGTAGRLLLGKRGDEKNDADGESEPAEETLESVEEDASEATEDSEPQLEELAGLIPRGADAPRLDEDEPPPPPRSRGRARARIPR